MDVLNSVAGRLGGTVLLWVLAAVALRAEEIALLPGEAVEVVIYGREDMSGERRIDSAGQLLVPLLGRIDAGGATAADLEARIAEELSAAGLMDDPEVFVDVARRRDVYVGGAVQDAGALPWTPDLTVEQAVTQAGGPRYVPTDEFGTLLQAYATVEDFEALRESIAELTAREARLRAEMAFTDMVFASHGAGGAPVEDGDLPAHAEALRLTAFLPPEADGLPPEEVPAEAVRLLGSYDIVAFRALQRAVPHLELVAFPEEVAADPHLADVRSTQQELMVDHVALNLATWNSLGLRREALIRQAAAYEEQHALVEESLAYLGAQVEGIRSLREQGLARESDLVDLQTAYATMLSSRVALLGAMADNDTAILQQDLAIQSFASSRRGELGRELELVRGELAEARSREDEARRAATIAASYRGTEEIADDEPRLLYEIRTGGSGELRTVGPGTPVRPGDMIVVSLIEDF